MPTFAVSPDPDDAPSDDAPRARELTPPHSAGHDRLRAALTGLTGRTGRTGRPGADAPEASDAEVPVPGLLHCGLLATLRRLLEEAHALAFTLYASAPHDAADAAAYAAAHDAARGAVTPERCDAAYARALVLAGQWGAIADQVRIVAAILDDETPSAAAVRAHAALDEQGTLVRTGLDLHHARFAAAPTRPRRVTPRAPRAAGRRADDRLPAGRIEQLVFEECARARRAESRAAGRRWTVRPRRGAL